MIEPSGRHAQFLDKEIGEDLHPHGDRCRANLPDNAFGLVPTHLVPGEVEKIVSFRRERYLRLGLEAEPQVALTAKGHDFLDLSRDQVRWNKAKGIIRKVGSAPITVWMKVLTDLLIKELGV